MPAINAIPVDKLARLIGTPKCPVIIDLRTDEERAADPRLVPAALQHDAKTVTAWAPRLADHAVVVMCQEGLGSSPGVAAWLRHSGANAEILEGGFRAWAAGGLPMIPEVKLPRRDDQGRTLWVTRARPKIDRIACPWLIRRFVDPGAVFLFVAPSEVQGVADQFRAAPFDIEEAGVLWTHRGDLCTFDVMVEELGLAGFEALQRLAVIVRGADTGCLDLAPEAPGLLAASLGLSRMYADDLAQLEAGMGVYDAFYRWCRDATDETHNWASHKPARKERLA